MGVLKVGDCWSVCVDKWSASGCVDVGDLARQSTAKNKLFEQRERIQAMGLEAQRVDMSERVQYGLT